VTTRGLASAFGLAALCAVAFAPGLTAPLIRLDDWAYLHDNAAIARPGLAGLLEVWDSSRAWSGAFFEYSPLRDTVYWAIFHAWGEQPLPYHLASLVFHVLATLLAWRLALRVGLRPWAAGLVAALFAVHPIHLESVMWMAALKDPMYTSLMLGSLVAYARYREAPRPGWYALALLGLLGALLCKSMAVSTPLLMVAMERLIGRPTPWREVGRRLAGPVAIVVVWVVQAVLIARAGRVIDALHGGSWGSHLVLAAWAQALYLRQVVAPANFRLVYCYPPVTGLTDARLWLGLAALATLAGLLLAWRRAPLRRFAVLWYLACLLPVSNLVPFVMVMQDRFLYAASFGFLVLVADLLSSLDPRLLRVVAPLAVILLAGVTASRASLWQTEALLWEDADLDPACMQDDAFSAAQAHLMHFSSAKDPEVRLDAFDRTFASRGFWRRPSDEVCVALSEAIHLAVDRKVPARAQAWVRKATQRCGDWAIAWAAVTAWEFHRDPRRAALAADRAHRLAPTPETLVLRGLAHLEAGDPGGEGQILQAIEASPPHACPMVAQFASEVGPAVRDRLQGATAACQRVRPIF
jgi:hypothetical protein